MAHPAYVSQSLNGTVIASATLKHEIRFMYLLCLLLGIAGIACLGSFEVTPDWTVTMVAKMAVQPMIVYGNGQCDVTPQEVPYMSLDANTPPTTLPDGWAQAGRSLQDFGLAQSCAAAFVMYYQTFDATNPKTLESATYMLSAAAKKRFYEGSKTEKMSIHMNPTWRTMLVAHHQTQIVRVGYPKMLDSHYQNGQLLVLMTVPYQVSQEIDHKLTTQNGQQNVEVGTVTPDVHLNGTGWQVTDWVDGAA